MKLDEAAKLALRDALYANLFDGQRGGKVTMGVDDLVTQVIDIVADRSEDLTDERGEHERFQMYTAEGNDAVAKMVNDVLMTAEKSHLLRENILANLLTGIADVAARHPEIHDTEPEWAIVDEVNPWLAKHGFLPVDREDLF